MVEETGRDMNAAITDGARAGKAWAGARDDLARRPQLAAREASVLLAAAERAIPVTVHARSGRHHPSAPRGGRRRAGATSYRDFKRLAASLPTLHDGGVVLMSGAPCDARKCFLKALTVARNLSGGKPRGSRMRLRHAAALRPRVNVVERPTLAGGRDPATGHHEILIPLLAWAVIRELDER